MKYVWEAGDIQPGRFVMSHGNRFLIGFEVTLEKTNYTITDMRDGMLVHRQSKAGIAQQLNEQNAIPTEIRT